MLVGTTRPVEGSTAARALGDPLRESRDAKFPSSAEDQTELCVELSVEPSQPRLSCCSSNMLVFSPPHPPLYLPPP